MARRGAHDGFDPVGEELGVAVSRASMAAFDGHVGEAAYSAFKSEVVGLSLPVVGSWDELAGRGRPAMRLIVTDAVPGELHAVAIEVKGRRRGSQVARLRCTEEGSAVTYTFSFEVPLLMSGIQRAYGNKQLARWLDALRA